MSMSSFTALLYEFSGDLTSQEVEDLKYLCKGEIGAGKLEKITKGYQLFETLEHLDLLSEKKDKRDYLASRLDKVGRNDLSKRLLGFQEEESPSLANLDELRRQLPNVPPTAPPSARRGLDDKDSGAGANAQLDGTVPETQEAPPEVFISYEWNIQGTVKQLVGVLKEAGYHCWMDIYQMGVGDPMNEKIEAGIRASKVVICCLTKKFCELSTMGQAEVNLAKELKKPILPLLFEPIDGPPKQLGLIFTNKLHLKMYETPEKTVEDKLQELLQKLREHVGH